MNIFITGGTGFIGRNLVENLSSKNIILTPSHKELELLDAEKVEKYLNKHKIDVVIHCSNTGGTRNTTDLPNVAINNLRMFFNIVRCRKLYKRMIFLGSGAEYDKRRPLKNVRESDFDKRVPIDEYGFYKYICSKYIQNSENVVNLRLFGVYGKYEDYNFRFISYALCRNILGLPMVINQNVFFDYLYVKDLVRIIDLFIKNPPKEKFINVGLGKRVDLLTIAKIINTFVEKKSEIIVKNLGLQNEYTCDNTGLMEILNNFKFTDLTISLKELYSYYKSIKSSLTLE